jgi:hypothetical protein
LVWRCVVAAAENGALKIGIKWVFRKEHIPFKVLDWFWLSICLFWGTFTLDLTCYPGRVFLPLLLHTPTRDFLLYMCLVKIEFQAELVSLLLEISVEHLSLCRNIMT